MTTAKCDDLHSKSSFFVTNKGQWNAKSGPKAEIRVYEQKLVKF